MFQGVRSLCSVAVAFARLAHALSRVLMSLCSPTSPAGTTSVISAPWQLPAAARTSKKVNPAALTVDDKPAGGGGKDHLLLVSPPLVPPALFNGECNAAEERTTAKAARGRRPSRLVIPPPVTCAAGVDPFGEVAGRETDVAPEVEVHGEGFCLASRRGVRHAMEDGYGVITTADNVGGDSQLAFYGVYDGHGGRAAVDFVADKLGKNVVAALAASTAAEMSQRRSDRPASSSSSSRGGEKEDEEHEVNAVMAAIRSAYLTTDSEFLSQGVRGGACAATALVKDGELYVAHVGDCRAVLGSRGGVATALTTDHTAGREDERRRIESSGGYVSCGNGGVWRVQDCLAVSRAFGDASMKPWVTCEPEISRRRLTPDCRFLVVASDGLWNKVSCQEAVDVVGAAATSSLGSCKDLVAMARTRGSRDDITVMVVDLQRFLR